MLKTQRSVVVNVSSSEVVLLREERKERGAGRISRGEGDQGCQCVMPISITKRTTGEELIMGKKLEQPVIERK